MEAATAKISADKKAVEADPAAAIRASLDDAMTQARQRLRRVLLTSALAAALAAAVVAAEPSAPAAGSHGAVAGTVTLTDAAGERFGAPGVQISLACGTTTAEPVSAASDEHGAFQFADVRPGRCSLTADLQGFGSVTTNLSVHAAETLQLTIHLNVTAVDAGFVVVAKSVYPWHKRPLN